MSERPPPAPVRTDRPVVPEGYEVPTSTDGLRPWREVEERLRAAVVVWLATVRPDGRPHVVPRWGAWLDGAWWYDGSPETVHVRNTVADPRCVLHLEDGTDAVILEGRASPLAEPPPEPFRRRLAQSMAARYGDVGYRPEPDAWAGPDVGGLCVFGPEKGLTWSEFPRDATRYRF